MPVSRWRCSPVPWALHQHSRSRSDFASHGSTPAEFQTFAFPRHVPDLISHGSFLTSSPTRKANSKPPSLRELTKSTDEAKSALDQNPDLLVHLLDGGGGEAKARHHGSFHGGPMAGTDTGDGYERATAGLRPTSTGRGSIDYGFDSNRRKKELVWRATVVAKMEETTARKHRVGHSSHCKGV